jgi:hypothetical protein
LSNKILLSGLLLALSGIFLIAAVYFVPITRQTSIRTYQKRELILHNLEDYNVESSNYFVSIYILRGRNIYADLVANASVDLFVVPLEEWNSSISEGREYDRLLAKYLNVSEVDSYFNAPEDGYYIFEIKKIDIAEGLRLNSFRIKEVWTELVDEPSEVDYNFDIIVWGAILTVVGSSIALYVMLPRRTPQGVLK